MPKTRTHQVTHQRTSTQMPSALPLLSIHCSDRHHHNRRVFLVVKVQ